VRRVSLASAVLVVVVLTASSSAHAGRILRIGVYSQNVSPRRAAVGARIHVADRSRGTPTVVARATNGTPQGVARSSSRSTPGVVREHLPNPYPALRSDSPLLRNPTPAGPGSLWYSDGSGHACMYAPDSVLPCFTVVAPPGAGAPGAPGVAPAAVAASVADRMPLTPGQIHASPSARGLTGAASWFWLDPAPQATVLSVTLAGERVTVTAEPDAVEWRFGDGGSLSGDVGVSYRPGPPPPDAITHAYTTRCLPGDQGRNPYVLSSCGDNGYTVDAIVSWRISFRASGPVGTSGTLPTRTTEASTGYPVSEARAFLVGGGSQ
jgi:hypothetical protein